MNWKQLLSLINKKYPKHCSLNPGASEEELLKAGEVLGVPLKQLDREWEELLSFANGLEVLGYSFYSVSSESINTITFKTIFLWEVNRVWKNQMFIFMGIGEKFEVGVIRSYLGAPCVAIIENCGYEVNEVLPLASNIESFLSLFAMEVLETLENTKSPKFGIPSLMNWPPNLGSWYLKDYELRKRINNGGLLGVSRMNEKYANFILESSQKISD